MEDTTTHKKIVVFDLNLDLNSNKQEESKYKHLPLVYKVMHDAAQYQTIVIQTTNGLSDGINFVRNQNITKGYLIASCGAIIYDITNNKIIDSIPLNNNVVYTIVHHGIMSNVNVGIYTADKKFIFVSDNVGYSVNKDNSYGPYDVIPSYDLLTKALTRTDIVDVSYFTYYGKFDKQFTEQLIGSLNHY
ncbi:MAG: HAD hydrolase family protein [Mycoplasmoidaceae bacterium]|nr:HAD hydrolase family protein [Mycoplasmoidaceae bacterium]